MNAPTGSIAALPPVDAALTKASGPWWEWMPDLVRGQRAVRWGPAIVLTRYQDCRAVLTDARVEHGALAELEGLAGIDPRFLARRRQSFLNTTGEEHARLRRLVIPALRPRQVNRYRPAMRRVMADLLDRALAADPVEAVSALTDPYPIPVICWILGIPVAESAFFSAAAQSWTNAFTGDPAAIPAAIKAHDDLDAFVTDLIARRRADLGEDLLSDLVRAGEDGDRLSDADIVHLVSALIVGGTDTTRNQLANALYLFAARPALWGRLVAHPEDIPAAVEEVTRYAPAIAALKRVVTEELDLGGGLVLPAGCLAVLATTTANRDPAVFADPDAFDVDRKPGQPHFGFGWGLRHCVGNAVARAELEEGLRVLTGRLAGLERHGEARWRVPQGIQGPTRLPLRLVTADA
jgi:cytochrome P450